MSDEELQTIWRQSIDHYGKRMQSIVCMEECAELIQAISKKLRDPTSPNDHLSEEMADVIICLHQLKLMYGITDKAIRDQVVAKPCDWQNEWRKHERHTLHVRRHGHHCRRCGEWRVRSYLGYWEKHCELYVKIFHYKEWDAISHHEFRQHLSKERRS